MKIIDRARHLVASLSMFALVIASNTACGKELTLEVLYGKTSLSGPTLKEPQVSPDGSRITYLQGKAQDAEQLDLWEYNVMQRRSKLLVDSKTILGGPETLSETEKSRRERQRISDKGIVEYSWDEEGKALLFPSGGDVYYLPLGGKVRKLIETPEFETDIRISPKGGMVSFIRDQDLFVIDLKTGTERQLTTDGEGTISNGVAEFVAQEEMGRYTGYWWAPDDSAIAFTQIDESPVKILERYEIDSRGNVIVIPQRYPRAGTANVLIRLGVVRLDTGAIRWVDLGPEKDIYLARVDWLPDSRLAFQRQSRDQKRIDLIFTDVENDHQKLILSEISKTWTNLTNDLKFLKRSSSFIWTSEKDGFRHIYLYGTDGKLIRQFTAGKWVVSEVLGVNEKLGTVLFAGFLDTPLEMHLYSVLIKGGTLKRLTREAGWHKTKVATEGNVFLDTFSSTEFPQRSVVKDLSNGNVISVLLANDLDKSHPYFPFLSDHAKTEFGTIRAEDGTELYYSLRKPPVLQPGKRYPAIVSVYGGPLAQSVENSWSLGFNQYLARNAYVVFQLDNRGTNHRGKAFEDFLYHKMGNIEVQDQLRGVEFLKTLSFVDPDRIGVHGWSYGGYMTLLMLMKGPTLFKAGFSGAPVTDWRIYDTHYTERYMGNPATGEADYVRASVFPYIGNLRNSQLLLIHGMADDNVIFDNSVQLITELQQRGILFEMMTYPGQRHGIYGDEQTIHVWKSVFDFFQRNLVSKDRTSATETSETNSAWFTTSNHAGSASSKMDLINDKIFAICRVHASQMNTQ